MRPHPWKCPSCREKKVWPVTVDYQTEMEHDGRAYSLRVGGLEILRCVQCGHQQLPDESYARLNDELRRLAGLLTPAQIAEKRRGLGLSQKEFSRLLGVAPETVSRWESGGQIQQRVMNDFIRAFFDLPELREYLKRTRDDATGGAHSQSGRVSARNWTPQKVEHMDEAGMAYYQSEKAANSTRPVAAAGS